MKKTVSLILSFLLLCSLFTVFVGASDESRRYLVVTDTVSVNSGKDVSAQLQKLIDENPNRTIFFPDGEYLLSSPLKTPADPKKSVSLELSDYAVIKAYGDWTPGEALIQLGGKDPYNNIRINGSNYALEGGIIDGSSVANGVSINSGRETAVRNVSIKNTVIGLHIMYGANSGSSDSDIYGVNIVGTGKTDSVGVLVEGFDNTLTNMRIANVFIGVRLNSAGNMLRNIHPLYTCDYTDYQNTCGFVDDMGNNWYDYCYSDQFGIGFRTTGNGSSIFDNCYCYWYSEKGGNHTAFKADKKFESTLTNFKAGFRDTEDKNIVLSVGELFGSGYIQNIDVAQSRVSDFSYKAYTVDITIFERIFGFMTLIFNSFVNLF